jgi:hypothetical protein
MRNLVVLSGHPSFAAATIAADTPDASISTSLQSTAAPVCPDEARGVACGEPEQFTSEK